VVRDPHHRIGSRPLWRLAGDHADVGYCLTFLHRGHGADIQDHAARRRTRFPHHLAEQIGDVADFHALLHVAAALDQGIENAGGFAADAGNALDPDWVLHRSRIARQHLLVAHQVQAAVDQRRHVFRLYGASVARLGREGRLPPQAGVGLQIASGVRVAGAINKEICDQNQEHLLEGAHDGKPSL